MLACAGFAKSTLWSGVLQPIVFLAVLLMSPDVRGHISVVPIRCAGLFIAYVLLLVRMRFDSLARRRTFILQRYFQVALDKAVESSRKADSILNHTLKNYMAGGAGEIKLFLYRFDGDDPMYAELHSATTCLQRGMRACRQRQAYLQLASGDYRLSLYVVDRWLFPQYSWCLCCRHGKHGGQPAHGAATTQTTRHTPPRAYHANTRQIMDHATAPPETHGTSTLDQLETSKTLPTERVDPVALGAGTLVGTRGTMGTHPHTVRHMWNPTWGHPYKCG